MSCPIVNSISLIEPVWRPFLKETNNPFKMFIDKFEVLTISTTTLGEIFPPITTGWISVEIKFEEFFQARINRWNKKVNAGYKITANDALSEIKISGYFISKFYNDILIVDKNIKNTLRAKLIKNIELPDYLDTIKILAKNKTTN